MYSFDLTDEGAHIVLVLRVLALLALSLRLCWTDLRSVSTRQNIGDQDPAQQFPNLHCQAQPPLRFFENPDKEELLSANKCFYPARQLIMYNQLH